LCKQILELCLRSLGDSRYQSRRMGAERHAGNHGWRLIVTSSTGFL